MNIIVTMWIFPLWLHSVFDFGGRYKRTDVRNLVFNQGTQNEHGRESVAVFYSIFLVKKI